MMGSYLYICECMYVCICIYVCVCVCEKKKTMDNPCTIYISSRFGGGRRGRGRREGPRRPTATLVASLEPQTWHAAPICKDGMKPKVV